MNHLDNGIRSMAVCSTPNPAAREVRVGSVDELAPGQRKLAFIDGRSIVLFNVGGAIRAIDNSCPHNGASLASGKLEGAVLQCPAHGLRFDLTTGRMPGSGGLQLKTLPVRADAGDLLVTVDEVSIHCRKEVVCKSTCERSMNPNIDDALPARAHMSQANRSASTP